VPIGSKGRTLALIGALVAVTSVWFFVARDRRGPTARLQADAEYYHCYLPSLLLDGDLDFENQYQVTQNWYGFGPTRTGKPGNVFGIGPAIFTLPFFAAGHAAARLAGERADGFSGYEVKASLYASLLYTLAAVVLAWRFLVRKLGLPLESLAAAALLCAAGPVVYYAIRQPGYAHPFAACAAAAFLYAWDASFDAPRTPRTWLLLGALLGAMALARPQLVLWGALLVPAVVEDMRRKGWRALGLVAAALAVALAVFSPQMLAWRAIDGAWLTVPQGPDFMRWDAPAWSEVLFSTRNGLLAYAPLYAVAGAGLLLAIRGAPRLALGLVAGVLLQVVANGAVWDWWGGGSFGGRRFDSCYLAFAFGLGWLVAWARRRGAAWLAPVAAVALACAAANLSYATRTSGPTARIFVGEPAWELVQLAGPPGASHLASWLSYAATFPARAAFAVRHRAPLSAYDAVVGVHFLAELYPGLGSVPYQRVETVPLARSHPFLLGFEPAAGGMAMRGARATVLVPLNLRPQRIALTVSFAEPGSVRIVWNGEEVLPATAHPGSVTASLRASRRGVSDLAFEAAAGTVLASLRFEAE
jgi:hypothetical protein